MQNIIDYVETEYASFEEKPFTRVDSLVLAELAYPKYDRIFGNYKQPKNLLKANSNTFLDGIVSFVKQKKASEDFSKIKFADLLKAEYFPEIFGEEFELSKPKNLLFAAAASPRFRDIELCFYVSEFDPKIEKQFAAITYILNDKTAYVAFRGTDNTIVGMKEDFNMAYICPVPAQASAVKYLDSVAPYLPPEIIVGGHSKGGNLAVYSFMKCKPEVQSRVKVCYSHDGPGFRQDVVDSADFNRIKYRVEKTVPQDSIVGLLLQNHEDYQVIRSNEKLLAQHSPFSWEVVDGDFVNVGKLSTTARYTDATLTKWVEKMSDSERMVFIDELFRIITASNAKSFGDIKKNWRSALPAMLEAIKEMNPSTRAIMLNIVNDLASISWSNL